MTLVAEQPAELPPPDISVIIPVVNEAETLGVTLASLHSASVRCEVIVVDAGSSDRTAAISEAADARVIESGRRQRAHQLNIGARSARGSILLFLHADTALPADALAAVVQALRDRNVFGGAFARRYASRSVLLRITCFFAGCRNRMIGWHLGDQAMFVRRGTFFHLGGFREVDQFEDLDFSRRLRRFGRTVTLRPGVTSSSRRFARSGPAATTLRDLTLTIRYLIRGLPGHRPDKRSVAVPAYEPSERIRSL